MAAKKHRPTPVTPEELRRYEKQGQTAFPWTPTSSSAIRDPQRGMDMRTAEEKKRGVPREKASWFKRSW
jgi:hypothetical protein